MQGLVRDATAEMERGEFHTGTNDGAVGADLQTRLKAITEAGGARLQSGTIAAIGARWWNQICRRPS
jgi:hypothetical protein